jgi:hypothetical protein
MQGRPISNYDDGTAENCFQSATSCKVGQLALEHHSASLLTSTIEVPVQALCQDKERNSDHRSQQQQQQQQPRATCQHNQGGEDGKTESTLQAGAQYAAECSGVRPMAKYDAKNPHHEHFRAYKNTTTAMCDVKSDGDFRLESLCSWLQV